VVRHKCYCPSLRQGMLATNSLSLELTAVQVVRCRILVLDEDVLQPICEARDCSHAINDLKYNPQATMLAAACADRHVDLYSVGSKRYSRVARCTGAYLFLESACMSMNSHTWMGHNCMCTDMSFCAHIDPKDLGALVSACL
jgi:hypothetical protein